MANPSKILLQTTIPPRPDDWHIGRFSLLKQHLESLRDESGAALYKVTARDRETDENGDDEVLSKLGESEFDELWLFAVDLGDGLSTNDCAGITQFRHGGGGILTARDHQDLGCSLCTLGGVGAANYFHSKNPDPDEINRIRDDQVTLTIDYPNYHSGWNGDFRTITPIEPVHEVLSGPNGSVLTKFPAHPHEGGIGIPEDDNSARVIAKGTSKTTGREFNLIVAFDPYTNGNANGNGRAVVQSSFHHLADYNWDIDLGCPTFVTEEPGMGYKEDPAALDDIKGYVANVAQWLTPVGDRSRKELREI